MTEGTYTLVVDVDPATTVGVGALGEVRFDAATYAYTGSAFGSGGLKRLDRHADVARGDNGARHWHVDYLLGAPESTLLTAYVTPEDVECEVARRIRDSEGASPVDGFGASDCDCVAHLHRADEDTVAEVYASYGGGALEPGDRD